MSDAAGPDSAVDTFSASDLDVESVKTESWQSLSNQMETSNLPGSATVSQEDSREANLADAQWLRRLSIVTYSSGTGGDAKKGIELSALRVNFNIKHAQAGSPAIFFARVYNLSPKTMEKIIQFTRVQVSAGHRYARYGMIFDGTVIQYRRGKENPTDTYLEIHGADGDDRANRNAVMANFAAGTEDKTVIMEIAKQLNMKIGYIDPEIGKDRSTRDTTVAESARSKLRELMQKNNATFHIENGELVMIKRDKTRPGEAVVLTPKTGLVGLPEITPQGLHVTCLLNPQIKVGGIIKVSASVISGVPYIPGSSVKIEEGKDIQGNTGGKTFATATWGHQLETAFTSPVGQYKVILMDHVGDTRGTPWFCNLICVALDDKARVILNPSSVFSRGAPEAVAGSTAAPTPPGTTPPATTPTVLPPRRRWAA